MPPSEIQIDCGSPGCLAKTLIQQHAEGMVALRDQHRQGMQALQVQHKQGMESIKEIIQLSMDSIGREIGDVKELQRGNGVRLGKVENRLTAIETQVGNEGLDKKVKTLISENEDIKWVQRTRTTQRLIFIGVAITCILAVFTFALALYDRHDMSRATVKQVQK